MECVRSVEMDIFHLRSQLIEVSPNTTYQGTFGNLEQKFGHRDLLQ